MRKKAALTLLGTGLVAGLGLSMFDAPVAAGVARISLAIISVVGLTLILYLASHGFDRAIMLDPSLPDLFANRGLAYVKTGQYARAIADLDKAIASNPRDAYSLFNRGVAKQQSGDKGRAAAARICFALFFLVILYRAHQHIGQQADAIERKNNLGQ